jgi:hypothetical protein
VTPGRYRGSGLGGEPGQASLLVLGVLAAVLGGAVVLFGFGQALGARGKHQRAADLAAVCGPGDAAQLRAPLRARTARQMVTPTRVTSATPPTSISPAAARRGANRNGVPSGQVDVALPDAGFAPTRVTVGFRGGADIRLASGRPPDRVQVAARATVELVPGDDLGLPDHADGGGYHGPLAYRQGKPTRSLFSAL